MYTGFSFKRDLTYNIFNIYNISEEILYLLKSKISDNIISTGIKVEKAPDFKQKIYRNIMDIPRFYFPDEYFKPVVSLSVSEGNLLKIEYPSQLTIKPNNLRKIVLSHSTDGHTREFAIPYYREHSKSVSKNKL